MALVVVTQARAEEERPTGDVALLQGRWKAWLSADEFMLFEIKGKSFTLRRHTGDRRTEPWEGTLAFDESTSPRQLTWMGIKSVGQDVPDNRCIYERHKNALLMIGGGASNRPEHFFSGGTSQNQTLVAQARTG